MPTQIPVEPERSWIAAAIATLIYSLLAAAVISATVFIIVWAYS
jgi:hypothetical protein